MSADASFRAMVHRVVARIPRGKVASYGLVALLSGKFGAARAVGRIMCEVERGTKLPCHRLIKSDGSLAPTRIFGGRQKKMLAAEGVRFKANGCVDMARCEWEGPRKRRLISRR